MRYYFFVAFLTALTACQTINIKNKQYKISASSPDLGSIGEDKSSFSINNSFQIRTLPTLENNIRVAVEVIPFNKKIKKIYAAKRKYNQNLPKVVYVDSLKIKPEIVTINLLDITGFVKELNTDYNDHTTKMIEDVKKIKVITGITAHFSLEDISKIKLADAYYISNNQEKKYSLALYKQGKKTENIEINPNTILAYKEGLFCWSENNRNRWYIADIISNNSYCKGKTYSKIKEKKKEERLFKL
jgi:hypothetical protein